MSSNGLRTNFWGPHAWEFLFSTIAGAYPVRVDPKNKDHVKTVKAFINMMKSLQYTMPCIWCRDSHKKHMREIPIEQYTGSRREMMKWLYLIHDSVNNKLIRQEQQCFERNKTLLIEKKLSRDQLRSKLKILREKIIHTKPSPSFASILARYEKQRAGKTKSLCH